MNIKQIQTDGICTEPSEKMQWREREGGGEAVHVGEAPCGQFAFGVACVYCLAHCICLDGGRVSFSVGGSSLLKIVTRERF